eukprot:1316153-Prymnesium_polylepis.1
MAIRKVKSECARLLWGARCHAIGAVICRIVKFRANRPSPKSENPGFHMRRAAAGGGGAAHHPLDIHETYGGFHR